MTGATLGIYRATATLTAMAVLGVVSFTALAAQGPNPNADWVNWLATATFSACCALIAIIYRNIVRTHRDDREAMDKRVSSVENGLRNLTEIHALLVGIVPGAPGGMIEDLNHLTRREREVTQELTKLKIQIALLEAAITTIPDAIVKLQKEREKRNDTES